MPRPRKNAPEGTSTPNIHRDASLVFARRPDSKRHAITHEILAADLATLHRDRGTIEVPGTT